MEGGNPRLDYLVVRIRPAGGGPLIERPLQDRADRGALIRTPTRLEPLDDLKGGTLTRFQGSFLT